MDQVRRRKPTYSGWLVTLLLSAMAAFSLVDRFIIAVIAVPASKSLDLSDVQMAFVMGPSFALLYTIASMPMAHWIDSFNRKRIVLFGVTLWGSMTIASGWSTSFEMLAITRSGIALGEAVLSPAAMSLIFDMFDREDRILPLTIYASAAAFMSSGAFVLGGFTLEIANIVAWPTFEAWRLTLVLAGVPSVILGCIFWFMAREHERSDSRRAVDDARFAAFLGYLQHHWRYYVPFFVGLGLFSLFLQSMFGWIPSILTRAFGLAPSHASTLFGLVTTPIQIIFIFGWPRIAMLVERTRSNHGAPVISLVSAAICLPMVLALAAPALWGFLAGISAIIACLTAWSILPALSAQLSCPGWMSARLSASCLLMMNLFGYGLGPLATVYLGRVVQADHRFDGFADPLVGGMIVVGLVTVPIMLLCAALCLRFSRILPRQI